MRTLTEAEIREKNRELYDGATNDLWRRVVYEPVHDGLQFTNIGGRHVLDFIGGLVPPASRLLDLCSGSGASAAYLVEHFGSRVVGVEMNAKQVAHARARREVLPARERGRLRFVEGDVCEALPEGPFDLAYAIDSLVLVPSPRRVLGRVHDALRPGAGLVLAEVTAGPGLREETREFAWKVDGMLALLSPDDYARALRELAFVDTELTDWTDLAVDCFEKIRDAVEHERDAIVRNSGEGAFEGWRRVSEVYVAAFRNRELTYTRISARRPESPSESRCESDAGADHEARRTM